jgi:hypothetical protein
MRYSITEEQYNVPPFTFKRRLSTWFGRQWRSKSGWEEKVASIFPVLTCFNRARLDCVPATKDLLTRGPNHSKTLHASL